MALKNKRILITAGPTWVAIDPVRVISNTASGETGRLLAQSLAKMGAKVTLLLGPGADPHKHSRIKVIRFNFFDDLKKLLKHELLGQYDAIIHSAAVSDYRPAQTTHTKIKSDMQSLNLRLVRTPKLIERIKKIAHNSYTIGFKFDPRTTKNVLLKSARELLKSSDLDAVVANTVINGSYHAFILTPDSVSGSILSKKDLAGKLIKLLSV
ncbi:MAG: phosphopantothenoylcysteine decarboxylase [Candidatus Omnitrophica bacterium]|jgi:phosphopantothenoylcysteine decarboxylase/phosphopantothenate--cysteine ligase|nr:phosphopantothenoylcysteine decarboxylase [Candidatus Omnitrophota bacterium]